METELRQLAFSEGFTADSGEELLKQIKSLAVNILHPSVHVISLHQMAQQESETVKAFSARVKGTASRLRLVPCQCAINQYLIWKKLVIM